jgi:hypothetical protein
MRPDLVGNLVNAAIPFLGGLYATLLRFRMVGKPLGADPLYDQKFERFGRIFKVLGPVLMLFALFLAICGLIRFS